ncbi:hypothetical protein [Flavobacterium notoginsengisoli]|uniref:hypothetical protein n=1 Tax=Flavobacterium notoginsengisoli TaxID=1478199 RepID=UPI00362F9AE4
MEKRYKITLPEPCQEDWNKMTPTENGRFCMSCSKTVVDFTSMMSEEIQLFFAQNQNHKICGRFRKSQLDTITIQIPDRVLYTQTNYYKMFLLALFIAMGASLFSCQNRVEKKQEIENIPVSKNTPKKEQTATKDTVTQKKDGVKNDDQITLKANQSKSATHLENNDLKSNKLNDQKNNSAKVTITASPKGEIVSETNAEFPGGIDQFYTFFAKEFKRPEDSDATKTRLAFAVEKNGSVSFLECSPSVDQAIENEIIRVLKLCPKWQPGQSDGKKVKRQYSLPITLQ